MFSLLTSHVCSLLNTIFESIPAIYLGAVSPGLTPSLSAAGGSRRGCRIAGIKRRWRRDDGSFAPRNRLFSEASPGQTRTWNNVRHLQFPGEITGCHWPCSPRTTTNITLIPSPTVAFPHWWIINWTNEIVKVSPHRDPAAGTRHTPAAECRKSCQVTSSTCRLDGDLHPNITTLSTPSLSAAYLARLQG